LVRVKLKVTGPDTLVEVVVIAAGSHVTEEVRVKAWGQVQKVTPASKVKDPDCPTTLQKSSNITPDCW